MEFTEKLKKLSLNNLSKDLLRDITKYHRIQGSSGLEEAVKYTASFLSSLGLEVKFIEIPSSSVKGFTSTPVSWNARRGLIEFKKNSEIIIRYSYEDNPTLISAHSPRGSGCGKLKLCKDVHDCSGDVVLVEAPAYLAYRLISANLIILYDSSRYPEAVPYTGIFLQSGEIKETSVVNIPYNTALKLISMLSKGIEIEVCWDIDTEYSTSPLHGVLAYNGSEPGVLYMSHICHPKPGAHDNASGVVANIIVAKIINSIDDKMPHAHLFIPEYTGTVFADSYLPWIPRGVVNLDMVGSKQWITNSTLNIIMPPLFVKSIITPYTYLASKLVLDEASSFGGFKLPAIKYSISPYTAGSDHDVTIMWGLDSTMLNEWPSRYYHTDMDDIDTISTQYLTKIAMASTLAGKMLISRYREEDVLSRFKEQIKAWYSIEALKTDIDVSGISKILDEQVTLKYTSKYTPISSRLLYKVLGLDKSMKLRKIEGVSSYLMVYAPLAYINNISNHLELYQLENLLKWNREETQLIEEAWELIKQELG